MLTQYFVSCVNVLFYFSLPLIFTSLAASISHFSPPLWISLFFFLRNSSPLFSITRSSSFSVIQVIVNIKNNAEKDTTLLLFFLSKSPGGHVISFQIKPWVAFGLPYPLIELFYIGMPVVRTDGRSFARSFGVRSRDYQIFSDAIDYHISLAMGLRSCAALRAGRHAPFARSFGVRSRDYQIFSDAIDYHISLAMGLRSCAALRAGRHAPLLKTKIKYNNYSGLPFEMQLLKGIK